MDFVTRLPIFTNWKGETYDSILVIIDWLTKIVYYKPVKVTINVPALAKMIINTVVHTMVSRTQWSITEAQFSLQSFDLYFITSSALSGNYLQFFTHKLMAKLRGKIAL